MTSYMTEIERQILIFSKFPAGKSLGMSAYELWSLFLTGTYDLLTFGLLFFVAYEALIKPKKPLVVPSLQAIPPDTEPIPDRPYYLDFVIDNCGTDITNVKITSTPDAINWGKIETKSGKPTSEYFHSVIPGIAKSDKLTFFWCDGRLNRDVISDPITITVEYDNPLRLWPPFRKRCKSNLLIDLKVYENVYWGLNRKFDVHNVAQELNRLRKDLQNYCQRKENS